MKFRKTWLMIMSASLIFAGAAQAECGGLQASISGSQMTVCWDADNCAGGSCTLTVRQDGCEVARKTVRCADGQTQLELGCVSGSYTMEMTHDDSCGETAPECRPTEEATEEPTEEPTAEPTTEPTEEPTTEPTIAPTRVPEMTSAPEADGGGSTVSGMASQVVALVNEARAQNGLGALSVDANLTSAACIRAQEIVEKFSHTRPDGSSWSTVSGRAYGENIAMGQQSAEKVMAAWMSSEGHRENILRSGFGSIGVCCYQSGGVYYWVQLFGK